MSAQAQKMRSRLAAYAKEREAFEQKKKELDEEMVRSRLNMGKIQKGLRNNEIIEEPIDISLPNPVEPSPKKGSSPSKFATPSSSQKAKSRPTPRPTNTGRTNRSGADDSKTPRSVADTTCPPQAVIIPSGPRVSEWCYSGQIDSDPPVVKANDIYEVVRLLGRGAFGDVNLVKCTEDNRLYAMKTIFTEREKDMKETLHEVRFLRMNRHPCIIDVHDAFMTAQPRMLYIVMPYCEGGDLDAVINTTKRNKMTLPEDKILRWSAQIALAIHFLHENGVIHRDLKPRNVMVTEGGDLVKVVDFGLAFSFREGQIASSVEAGTPFYTAPEMIRNLPYAYPADCWSFGVLLHEMLRLDLPFVGSSTADLVKAILSDEPPQIPSHYSTGIKNVASALLNKEPEKRLGMAGLLLDPLFQSKTVSFPQSYRPKAVEERIRRAQARQLTQQIDYLPYSKNSSRITVGESLSLGTMEQKNQNGSSEEADNDGAQASSEDDDNNGQQLALESPDADMSDAQTSAVVAALEGVALSQDELEASAGDDGGIVEGNHHPNTCAGNGNGSGHILGGRKGQAIAEALSAAEEIAAEMGGDSVLPEQQQQQEEKGEIEEA